MPVLAVHGDQLMSRADAALAGAAWPADAPRATPQSSRTALRHRPALTRQGLASVGAAVQGPLVLILRHRPSLNLARADDGDNDTPAPHGAAFCSDPWFTGTTAAAWVTSLLARSCS